MKKQKTQQGITLIALIITIVVLLILAVVTINELRDGGIITHAQNAVNDYTIAQEKEKISLAYSEYLMNKRTNANATLEVEGATVTGSEENGWEVTFDKTNNTYEVDKDGNVEIVEELVISEEKEIDMIAYLYTTQYNPSQPEIISISGYDKDENSDGMIDDLPSQAASINGSTEFNIKNTFFEEEMLTEGNINAKITHLDGRVEDIILTTTDNKLWIYEGESYLENENVYIGFRPNAKYKYITKAEDIDCYEESNEYHYMYISSEVVVPFYKLELFGRIMEFPFLCEAIVANGDIANNIIHPIYTNANDVREIVLNLSNETKKVYKADKIYYESKEPEPKEEDIYKEIVLLMNGECYFPVLDLEAGVQITSIIIEEDGILTKYNVTDDTLVGHLRPST